MSKHLYTPNYIAFVARCWFLQVLTQRESRLTLPSSPTRRWPRQRQPGWQPAGHSDYCMHHPCRVLHAVRLLQVLIISVCHPSLCLPSRMWSWPTQHPHLIVTHLTHSLLCLPFVGRSWSLQALITPHSAFLTHEALANTTSPPQSQTIAVLTTTLAICGTLIVAGADHASLCLPHA
jgi:hypothetical protein